MTRHADDPRADYEPSADELTAMAYADGELSGAELEAFERRLAAEPDLSRAVAEYRELEILARQMAPPEPADHEWERLSGEFSQRAGLSLGHGLVLLGAVGLLGVITVEWARSDMDPASKALTGALGLGLCVLFALVARARLRTLPFDPYRKVKR
jgi:anti-sigma factor RsiW